MTAEELERLVNFGVPDKLVEALSSLDESKRKPLAKTAARLFREANDRRWVMPQISCEALAVLGLCSWSDAKRVSVVAWAQHVEPVYWILKARRPEWLPKWVEKELADRWGGNWALVRRLVRDGICARPAGDLYITRMIQSRAGYGGVHGGSLADWLRQDGKTVMDLWRIFEIDFGREMVLWGEAEGQPTGWLSALVGLANTGELSRQRMLTASLTARQSRPENATFFGRLHEALSPTIDERIERQEHYRAPLSNPIPNVVGFALGALKVIAKSGRLEIAPFLSAVGPALELRQKGHATSAVQVLELASKQSPQQLQSIAAATARGLANPSPDVQKQCAKLIATAAAMGPDPELATAIAAQIDSVTASVKAQVEAALAMLGPVSKATPADGTDGAPGTVAPAEIDAVPSRWRELAGVDACLQALNENAELPPLQFDPMAVPRLDPGAALTPIAQFDELVDRLSAAVEDLADADELDLLLDGLGRLSRRMRLDFSARTAPLLNRVAKLIETDRWNAQSLDPVVRFRFLIRSWLDRNPLAMGTGDIVSRGFEGFLAFRMAALSSRLQSDLAGPLLACPTHRGGWIDPRTLVTRLRYWQEQDVPGRTNVGSIHEFSVPDPYDFIQALLRLAPDHRAQALRTAADLSGEAGAATRFALGGDEPIGPSAGLWIAAARAREPHGTFPALAELHGDLGPDAAMPASYQWEPADPNFQESWKAHPTPQLCVQAVPAVRAEQLAPDRPLAYLNRLQSPYYFTSVLHLRCRAAVWPANPEASFASGAMEIVARLNDPPSSFSPTTQALEQLFDPDTPFSEMARLVLAVALLCKDTGTRGLGIDALIALIEDGRCTGNELGPIYGKLASRKDMVRLNRLTASLAEAARVSQLHQWVVVRILAGTLAALGPTPPDDLHHLLSALHEGLIATNQSLPADCRPILESISTSGKTARLAKSLLAMRASPGANPHRLAAMNLALSGRVARATRWA